MRSLPQVVLHRKDCRKNVREIPLLVARKKIKIDYFYWFSVSYRLVIEIGNPEIVYFSTTKQDGSRSLGLFKRGKTRISAKLHRTDLIICTHSREGKTPFYSRINTVLYPDYFLTG